MKIGAKEISSTKPVYFIAEAGVNHEGNEHLAKALLSIAAWAGVDAVKVQTFKADLIVTKKAAKAEYQQTNLKNQDSQYDMLKKLELDELGHEKIKKLCVEEGIEFLSTPHSGTWSVDYLESLGVAAFKIASPDITNIPFLKYVAKKQRPIIISTGMATLEETKEAIQAIQEEGNKDLVVLHCTTNYPCPYKEVNLRAMLTIKEKCNVEVGYSDHTPGIIVPIMATALGAVIIEKHYTIDKNLKGNSPDHVASLAPQELKDTMQAIRWVREQKINDPVEAVKKYYEYINEQVPLSDKELEESLGTGIKKPTEAELRIMPGIRKSIVATMLIKKGEVISVENIDVKRPNSGLAPKYFFKLSSKNYKATRDINSDEPITLENTNFNL